VLAVWIWVELQQEGCPREYLNMGHTWCIYERCRWSGGCIFDWVDDLVCPRYVFNAGWCWCNIGDLHYGQIWTIWNVHRGPWNLDDLECPMTVCEIWTILNVQCESWKIRDAFKSAVWVKIEHYFEVQFQTVDFDPSGTSNSKNPSLWSAMYVARLSCVGSTVIRHWIIVTICLSQNYIESCKKLLHTIHILDTHRSEQMGNPESECGGYSQIFATMMRDSQ